jgi:hypothetical protein
LMNLGKEVTMHARMRRAEEKNGMVLWYRLCLPSKRLELWLVRRSNPAMVAITNVLEESYRVTGAGSGWAQTQYFKNRPLWPETKHCSRTRKAWPMLGRLISETFLTSYSNAQPYVIPRRSKFESRWFLGETYRCWTSNKMFAFTYNWEAMALVQILQNGCIPLNFFSQIFSP